VPLKGLKNRLINIWWRYEQEHNIWRLLLTHGLHCIVSNKPRHSGVRRSLCEWRSACQLLKTNVSVKPVVVVRSPTFYCFHFDTEKNINIYGSDFWPISSIRKGASMAYSANTCTVHVNDSAVGRGVGHAATMWCTQWDRQRTLQQWLSLNQASRNAFSPVTAQPSPSSSRLTQGRSTPTPCLCIPHPPACRAISVTAFQFRSVVARGHGRLRQLSSWVASAAAVWTEFAIAHDDCRQILSTFWKVTKQTP